MSHSVDTGQGHGDGGPRDEAVAGRSIAFGLIVIGDEVLNGTRRDAHLPALREKLAARGHELAWYWMLPDEPRRLAAQLAVSMAGVDPVLCCGGIGATPDDHTRACAADAAGVELIRHPEAAALIEARFGREAHPHRILMADLPAGSTLIPNPVSRVPGFGLKHHWFLPGFPTMAGPMADWVLDHHYGRAEPMREAAVKVRGVPESRLIPLMRDLGMRFPGLKLFSLPHLGDDRHILLGFRGRQALSPAMAALEEALRRDGMVFERAADA
jgi:molybdopterin-biosynthesis enzyme MoeA-like protein